MLVVGLRWWTPRRCRRASPCLSVSSTTTSRRSSRAASAPTASPGPPSGCSSSSCSRHVVELRQSQAVARPGGGLRSTARAASGGHGSALTTGRPAGCWPCWKRAGSVTDSRPEAPSTGSRCGAARCSWPGGCCPCCSPSAPRSWSCAPSAPRTTPSSPTPWRWSPRAASCSASDRARSSAASSPTTRSAASSDKMIGSLVLATVTIAATSAACFIALPFFADDALASVSSTRRRRGGAPRPAAARADGSARPALHRGVRGLHHGHGDLLPQVRADARPQAGSWWSCWLRPGRCPVPGDRLRPRPGRRAAALRGAPGRRLPRAAACWPLRPSGLSLPVRAVRRLPLPTLTGELVFLSMTTGSVVLLGSLLGCRGGRGVRGSAAGGAPEPVRLLRLRHALPADGLAAVRRAATGSASARAYWHTAVVVAVLSFPVLAMTTVFAAGTTELLFGERYTLLGPGARPARRSATTSTPRSGFNAYTLAAFGRGRSSRRSTCRARCSTSGCAGPSSPTSARSASGSPTASTLAGCRTCSTSAAWRSRCAAPPCRVRTPGPTSPSS